MGCSRNGTEMVLASLLVLALAGCASGEPIGKIGAPLAGGSPDGHGHPAVGTLSVDPDGDGPAPPFGWCTGFVVSDDVAVTAAHCLAPLPSLFPGAQLGMTLEGGSPSDPVIMPGLFPDDQPFFMLTPVVSATDSALHPMFGADGPRSNDVAVLLFPEGTFAHVEPVELPCEGELDDILEDLLEEDDDGDVDEDEDDPEMFTLVGYGLGPLDPPDDATGESLGYRQVATAPAADLTDTTLHLQFSSGGATCPGDSGGPHFHEDDDVAVALNSGTGGNGCGPGKLNTLSNSQRLDIAVIRDFLSNYVSLDQHRCRRHGRHGCGYGRHGHGHGYGHGRHGHSHRRRGYGHRRHGHGHRRHGHGHRRHGHGHRRHGHGRGRH